MLMMTYPPHDRFIKVAFVLLCSLMSQYTSSAHNETLEIACRPPISTGSEPGLCGHGNIFMDHPFIVQDGCGDLIFENDAPDFFEVGVTHVTWIVTDACGNSATCMQDVLIYDQEAPVIECPPAITLEATTTDCGTVFGLVDPPITDNCTSEVEVFNDAPPVYPSGLTVVTWTAIDYTGNSSSCTQNVTVVDTQAPTFVFCPSSFVVQGSNCEAIPVFWDSPVAIDNCANVQITSEATPGQLMEVGQTEITYTGTDDNGNVATCSFTIQVTNGNAGSSGANGFDFCPEDIQVFTSCQQPVAVDWPEPIPNDDCYENLFSNLENGGIFEQGSTTVTYTLQDYGGAAYYCSFDVKVIDDGSAADGFTSCPEDILIDASCDPKATVSWNAPVPNSDCYADLYSNYQSGDLFSLGTTEVIYTLVDFDGNEYYCSFKVKVFNDGNGSNGFTFCPQDIFVDASCQESVQVFWDEPTPQSTCYEELTSDFESGDFFIPGNNVVTYTLTDLNGNTSVCSFNVLVFTTLSIYVPGDIEVAIPQTEDKYHLQWNGPEAISGCELCPAEEDLEGGYTYLGTYFGHRYYSYSGTPISWADAAQVAQDSGGYLVSINTPKEDEFIRNVIESETEPYFIGLQDITGNGDYQWADGSALTLENWLDGAPLDLTGNDVVFFRNDVWENQDASLLKRRFIMEIPCVEFELVEGIPNDSEFPMGTTSMHYVGTDWCGNTCEGFFDVTINHDQGNYAKASGVYSNHHIKSLKFVGQPGSKTNDDGGYEDYTDLTIGISMDIPKFRMKADRNTEGDLLYWRIWFDLNQDGDFSDTDELLYERASATTVVDILDIPNGIPDGFTTRLRVAVSEYVWPELYGFTFVGEVEDYTVTFYGDALQEGGNAAFIQTDDEPTTESPLLYDLFPNPVRSRLIFVEGDRAYGLTNIEVYNQLGQRIALQQVDNLDTTPIGVLLPIGTPNGIYQVVVTPMGQKSVTKSFIVQQ